jgi:hypothetical protein
MAGLNLFTNNASTALASGITAIATSLTVTSATGGLFPNPTGGQYFYCTLSNTSGTVIEIVKVTARTTDTFTIVRGQDGTSASAFSTGDKVELRLTAADLQNFPQLDSTNTFASAQTFSSAPILTPLTGLLYGNSSSAVTAATAAQVVSVIGSTAVTNATNAVNVTGTVGVANGGTGLTTATAYSLLAGGTTSTGAFQSLASVGTTGQVLTSNGASALPTWQNAAGGSSGATNYTFTSATTNFTLTSSSNQVVAILGNTTTSIAPSLTMPAMNSGMTTGFNRFVFQNFSPYGSIALKDSGGTIRQFTSGSTYGGYLTIKDTSTASGFWYTSDFSVNAIVNSLVSTSSILVNAGYSLSATPKIVTLDATNAAVVWTEYLASAISSPTAGNNAIYAQLVTVNTTTKAITLGNRVTIAGPSQHAYGSGGIDYDSDNAGHALVLVFGRDYGGAVCCGQQGLNVGGAWFGLSVSGGTLYATTLSSQGFVGSGNPTFGNQTNSVYVSYLGSNSAYAFCFSWSPDNGGAGSYHTYIGGATVTGTTAPSLTNSANNGDAYTNPSAISIGTSTFSYGSRTNLTTFTLGSSINNAGTTIGYYASYTPASNTFTRGARSTSTRLAAEQGSLANFSSFANGGFMYCPNKVIFGKYVYTITNAGAAGVTTTSNTTVTAKGYLTPNYSLVSINQVNGLFSAARNGIFGSTITVFGNFTCDTTAADFNINGSYTTGSSNTALFSTSTALSLAQWNTSGYTFNYYDLATPLTAV